MEDISINLRHMSGEDVRIKYAGLPVRIPGFEGFSVLGASGRTVSIRHPDNAPCLSFSNKGVECDTELNTSLLQLAIESINMPLPTIVRGDVEPSATESTPVNPFDVIRRSAASGGSATETDNSMQFRTSSHRPCRCSSWYESSVYSVWGPVGGGLDLFWLGSPGIY